MVINMKITPTIPGFHTEEIKTDGATIHVRVGGKDPQLSSCTASATPATCGRCCSECNMVAEETAVGRGAMSSYGPTKILFLFNPLPHECTDALFAAYRTDDWRRLDSELIVFDLDKTLLIGSAPRLVPRYFEFCG